MEYTRLPNETLDAQPVDEAASTNGAAQRWAVRAEKLYLRYDGDGPMVFNGLSLKIEVGVKIESWEDWKDDEIAWYESVLRLNALELNVRF